MALWKAKLSLYFIKTKKFAFGTGYLVDKLGGNFSLGAWVLPIIFVTFPYGNLIESSYDEVESLNTHPDVMSSQLFQVEERR
jgi:hypothetical protein